MRVARQRIAMPAASGPQAIVQTAETVKERRQSMDTVPDGKSKMTKQNNRFAPIEQK